MLLEDLLPNISLGFTVAIWIVFVYYVVRTRRPKQTTNSLDIGYLIAEINRRLERQDHRILDQQVKMDVLETSLERQKSQERTPFSENSMLPGRIGRDQGASEHPVASQTSQVHVIDSLDPTANQILTFLVAGSRTPHEIQEHIGRSREHTARLMKRLFEQGFVDRNETKRPFVYRIKRIG